tara:strand:+ start:2044 stop:2511 length:468 start_codon:yes stop_codon:yes gene_type:complete
MEEGATSLLAWAGWITGIILGLGGYAFSSLGWYVRGRQSRSLAVQKDIHDTIDRTVKSLTDFEDAVYSYWSEASSEIRLDQLVLLHNRCLMNLKQLKHLKPFTLPIHELAQLRRHATLDAESEARPLTKNFLRLKKFSRALEKILNADFLLKSWR